MPYIYFCKRYNETTQSYDWGDQRYESPSNANWGNVYFKNEVLKIDEPYGTGTRTHIIARDISKDFVIISAGLEDKFTKDGLITSFQDGTED